MDAEREPQVTRFEISRREPDAGQESVEQGERADRWIRSVRESKKKRGHHYTDHNNIGTDKSLKQVSAKERFL